MNEHHADARALDDALDRLHAYRDGVLLVDEHFIPTKFVTDPSSGKIVLPVPEAVFFAPECILFVPEESHDALQLMLSPEREEESLLTDRWRTYHGDPEMVRWASCWIDAGKREPFVFDGDALMRADPLAGDEPWLVRTLNEDQDALRAALSDRVGKSVEDALGVGVGERGCHVRARFGVIRLPFDTPIRDAQSAYEAILTMLGRPNA